MPIPLAHTPEPSFALTSVFYSRSAMAPYANPQLDEVILKGAGLLDSKLRAGEITRAYRMLLDDTGAIPLWSAVKTLAMRPEVNYIPASSETVRLVNVNWKAGV
jgi:ABC-type transport system substrate-binding protein